MLKHCYSILEQHLKDSLGNRQIGKLIFYFLWHRVWHHPRQISGRPGPGRAKPSRLSNMGRVWYNDCTRGASYGTAVEAFSWTTKMAAPDVSHILLLWLVVGLSNCVQRHFGLPLLIMPLGNWVRRKGSKTNMQLRIGLATSGPEEYQDGSIDIVGFIITWHCRWRLLSPILWN